MSGNNVIFLAVMVGMFYLMIIRPHTQRQKEQKALMEALGKGSEVITSGGVLGKIVKVSEGYVTLEVASDVEIVVQKSAVITLLPTGTIKSVK